MKTGIVGSGFVGATAAYALVMRGVGRRLVLVDQNRARAESEADDILHALPFAHPLEVTAGDYADLAGCKVVIVFIVMDMQRTSAFRSEDGFAHIKGTPGLLTCQLVGDSQKFQYSASLGQNCNRLWKNSTHKDSL